MNEIQCVGFQCVSLLCRLPYVLSVMQVIILFSIHHFNADSSFSAVNLLSNDFRRGKKPEHFSVI